MNVSMKQIKNVTGQPQFDILASVMLCFLSCFTAMQTVNKYSHSSKPRQLSATAHPPKLLSVA